MAPASCSRCSPASPPTDLLLPLVVPDTGSNSDHAIQSGDIYCILDSIRRPVIHFLQQIDQQKAPCEQYSAFRSRQSILSTKQGRLNGTGKIRPCVVITPPLDDEPAEIMLMATFEGVDANTLPSAIRRFLVPVRPNRGIKLTDDHVHTSPEWPVGDHDQWLMAYEYPTKSRLSDRWKPDGHTTYTFDAETLSRLESIATDRLKHARDEVKKNPNQPAAWSRGFLKHEDERRGALHNVRGNGAMRSSSSISSVSTASSVASAIPPRTASRLQGSRPGTPTTPGTPRTPMTARPINYATSVRSTNAGPRSSVELPTTPRGLTDSMKQLDITGTTIITTTTVGSADAPWIPAVPKSKKQKLKALFGK